MVFFQVQKFSLQHFNIKTMLKFRQKKHIVLKDWPKAFHYLHYVNLHLTSKYGSRIVFIYKLVFDRNIHLTKFILQKYQITNFLSTGSFAEKANQNQDHFFRCITHVFARAQHAVPGTMSRSLLNHL